MRAIVCFVLIVSFVHIAKAVKSKSINLALETVLQFDKKDHTNDVKVINNVQKFLDNIKEAISKDKTGRRSYNYSTQDKLRFTDFIAEAAKILKTFDDNTLEDVFSVLDDESRKFNYKGCKFYELVDNIKVRRFMSDKLEEVRDMPPKKLRKYLDKIVDGIQRRDFSDRDGHMIDVIDYLYIGADKLFDEVLQSLKTYKLRAEYSYVGMQDIIATALRSLVFDYYSNLKDNTRQYLRTTFNDFWTSYENNYDRDSKSGDRMGKDFDLQLNVVAVPTLSSNAVNNWGANTVTKKSFRLKPSTLNEHDDSYSSEEKKASKNKRKSSRKITYFERVTHSIKNHESLRSKKKIKGTKKDSTKDFKSPPNEEEIFLNYVKDKLISIGEDAKQLKTNYKTKTPLTSTKKVISKGFLNKGKVKSPKIIETTMKNLMLATVDKSELLDSEEEVKPFKSNEKLVENLMTANMDKSDATISKEEVMNHNTHHKDIKIGGDNFESKWRSIKNHHTTSHTQSPDSKVESIEHSSEMSIVDSGDSSYRDRNKNRNKRKNIDVSVIVSGVNKKGKKRLHRGLKSDLLSDDLRIDGKNTFSSEVETGEVGLLTGGQRVHDMHYRAGYRQRQTPKKHKVVTEEFKKATRTEKFSKHNDVINVKLPIEALRRVLNAPSYRERAIHQVETTKHGLNHKIEKEAFFPETTKTKSQKSFKRHGRKSFTAFAATISHEGLSIESFENDDIDRRLNQRKSDDESPLEEDASEKSVTKDVNKLIHNLEKQLEDVKVQIKLAKSIEGNKTAANRRNSVTSVYNIEDIVGSKTLPYRTFSKVLQENSAKGKPTETNKATEHDGTTTEQIQVELDHTNMQTIKQVTSDKSSIDANKSDSSSIPPRVDPVFRGKYDDVNPKDVNENKANDTTDVSSIEDHSRDIDSSNNTMLEDKEVTQFDKLLIEEVTMSKEDDIKINDQTRINQQKMSSSETTTTKGIDSSITQNVKTATTSLDISENFNETAALRLNDYEEKKENFKTTHHAEMQEFSSVNLSGIKTTIPQWINSSITQNIKTETTSLDIGEHFNEAAALRLSDYKESKENLKTNQHDMMLEFSSGKTSTIETTIIQIDSSTNQDEKTENPLDISKHFNESTTLSLNFEDNTEAKAWNGRRKLSIDKVDLPDDDITHKGLRNDNLTDPFNDLDDFVF